MRGPQVTRRPWPNRIDTSEEQTAESSHDGSPAGCTLAHFPLGTPHKVGFLCSSLKRFPVGGQTVSQVYAGGEDGLSATGLKNAPDFRQVLVPSRLSPLISLKTRGDFCTRGTACGHQDR